MNDSQLLKEISSLKPWNSKKDAIKVNSIRYNQDFSLLTLGTSKGYRIFLTSNFKLCSEETETNNNFGNIMIAMAYYQSALIFLLPSKQNEKYSNKELIIFDDYYQNKIASFKEKKEDILNFFLSKNVLFIMTLNKIIVVELFSFKTIDIIEKINYNQKLLSLNFFDYLAFTYFEDKKNINIKFYQNENYKIISQTKKIICPSFNFIQIIQLSPLGDLIGVLSVFGNKIHVYYTKTGKLKECIYMGPTIHTMEKMIFSEKKPNYIFFLKNSNIFYVYKMKKEKNDNPNCVCDKYDDNIAINANMNEQDPKNGIIGLMRKSSKNRDIKDVHAFSEIEGRILFFDFDRNKHKDLILIKYNGQLIKYHVIKKKSGNISPILNVQWI